MKDNPNDKVRSDTTLPDRKLSQQSETDHEDTDRFGQRARDDDWVAEVPGSRDEEVEGVNYREGHKHKPK